jgi:hypothetical protein
MQDDVGYKLVDHYERPPATSPHHTVSPIRTRNGIHALPVAPIMQARSRARELEQQLEELRTLHARRVRTLERQLAQANAVAARRPSAASTPAAAMACAARGAKGGAVHGSAATAPHSAGLGANGEEGSGMHAGEQASAAVSRAAALQRAQLRARERRVAELQAALRQRDEQVGGTRAPVNSRL